MSRRGARRSALFALYKWDLTGKLELDPDADDYTRETVEAVQAHAAALDERITASAEGWPANRLEETRAKLEATQDPQEAVDVLAELSEIAKAVEAEVERAKREAESAGS